MTPDKGGTAVALGKQLQRWRSEAGFSQEKVAHMLGVHRNSISRWENGEQEIGAVTYLQYCKIVGISWRRLRMAPDETRFVIVATIKRGAIDPPEMLTDENQIQAIRSWLLSRAEEEAAFRAECASYESKVDDAMRAREKKPPISEEEDLMEATA